MLDHLSIHVSDVECAIRRISERDRAEPQVARGKELRSLFVRSALSSECDTVRTKFFAMDQVAADIGDERIALEILPQRRSAVDRDPTGAGKISGRSPATLDWTGNQTRNPPFRSQNTPGFVGANAKDRSVRAINGNIQCRRGQGILHFGKDVIVCIHDLPDMSTVAAN